MVVKITIEYIDKGYATIKSLTVPKDKVLISEIGPYAELLLKECKLEVKYKGVSSEKDKN